MIFLKLKFYLPFALLILAWNCNAQEVKPEVISSVGAKMEQGSVKLNFTVGEIVVNTNSNGNITLGQGFTSSAASLIKVTAVKEPDASTQLNIYPNPTSNLLYIDINNDNVNNVKILIYNIEGKQISSEIYSSQNNHIGINFTSFLPGNYFVKVVDIQNSEIASYQIIKL